MAASPGSGAAGAIGAGAGVGTGAGVGAGWAMTTGALGSSSAAPMGFWSVPMVTMDLRPRGLRRKRKTRAINETTPITPTATMVGNRRGWGLTPVVGAAAGLARRAITSS